MRALPVYLPLVSLLFGGCLEVAPGGDLKDDGGHFSGGGTAASGGGTGASGGGGGHAATGGGSALGGGGTNPTQGGGTGQATGGGGGGGSAAGCIVCTDFESGSLAKATNSCSGTGDAGIDSSQAHSGQRSLHVIGGGGYCNHVFGAWPLAGAPSTFWVRFWIRASKALTDNHVSFLALHDTVADKDLRMGGQNSALMFNRESDDATLPAIDSVGKAASRPLTPLTWTCVEVQLDQTQATITAYVDGTLVPGLVEDGTPTQDIDSQWLSQSWHPSLNDVRLGWESYGSDENELWFDDLYVGTTRPGCQ